MNTSKRKNLSYIILIVLLVGLLVWLALFLHHRMRYAISNAVFVETDKLVYSSFSQVAGKIIKVSKDEGETVKKGDVLAILDDSPYQKIYARLLAEKASAEKEKEALKIAITRLKQHLALKESQVQQKIYQLKEERKAALAQVEALSSQIAQLQRDQKRFATLVAKNLAPKRKLEEIETNLKQLSRQQKALAFKAEALKYGLVAAKKELAMVENQKKTIKEQKERLKALEDKIKALSASVAAAKLNLKYTKLVSPIDGIVAKRFHVAGDVVGPGQPVYALVDPKNLYILVLLEETKLKGVEVGCPVNIKIDAFPDEKFKGEVAEILPATAAKFALVPRDVSAGEFTKVAQRVPIKIRITEGPVKILRVGLGGEVEIKRK
ncbi:secretion protein HlyD family protein [Thermodesulfatator indicus DSM 15286]|uniref:Secretion protein HlyD family protein n=1 Tax=Thermodesulfatator indicus (strain DSM 15286 / JCM 11887 / CIR29812) TaxID=667014 RepID=F8ACT5_THEID|nr:HlyD family secretion protein [Thermodesulfatator indicus]AEH44726.1 secretion protein HlyD family protein [Thermodesulfatator indicus DSM 15286]